MPRFKIKYRCPDTGEELETIQEFSDSAGRLTDGDGKFLRDAGIIPARVWAEDYAYSIADKGPYKIEELK